MPFRLRHAERHRHRVVGGAGLRRREDPLRGAREYAGEDAGGIGRPPSLGDRMPGYDAIVIGAGLNGLAAASVLAKNGLRVACLEKTNFPGGMAATKELFPGFKHSVGAWALILLQEQMEEILELRKYGYEVYTPRTSFCSFGEPGDVPFIAHNDPQEM